jgi:hypothetical protein
MRYRRGACKPLGGRGRKIRQSFEMLISIDLGSGLF